MSIARRKPQVCAAVPGCQVSRRAETLDRAEAAFVGHPNGGLVLLEPKDAWEMGEKQVFFMGKIIQLWLIFRHWRPFSLI